MEIYEMMLAKAKTKGINLDMRYKDEGIPKDVIGDYNRFQQVAITLVENAITYTSQGTVTMSYSYNRAD
jgi:signal transduction histidine kinase